MILTKKALQSWSESAFLTISKEQEKAILLQFGQEPGDGYQWSEQDIYEQVRKMLL